MSVCSSLLFTHGGRILFHNPFPPDVYDALDGICHMDNFRTYKFIPPQMVRACQAFLDRYGEDLEVAVWRDPTGVEESWCRKPCEGEVYISPEEEQAQRAAEAATTAAAQKKKTKTKSKTKSKKKQTSKRRKKKKKQTKKKTTPKQQKQEL